MGLEHAGFKAMFENEINPICANTYKLNIDIDENNVYVCDINDLLKDIEIHNNVTYLDVKTTGYNFEQKMIFSNQEIAYIAMTPNPYCIYRLYKNNTETYLTSICDDCKSLSTNINLLTKTYNDKLSEMQVGFRGAKLAIAPTLSTLSFRQEI